MSFPILKLIGAIALASTAGLGVSAHAAGAIISSAGGVCKGLFAGDAKRLEFDEFGAVRNKSADRNVTLVCTIPVSVGNDGLILGVAGSTPANVKMPFCDGSAIDQSGIRQRETFLFPPGGGKFNTTLVFDSSEITRYARMVSVCTLPPFGRLETFSAEEINF
jgi:hypothetical protein